MTDVVREPLRRRVPPELWRRASARYWAVKRVVRERRWRLMWAAGLSQSAIPWPWFRRAADPDLALIHRVARQEDWRRISTWEARLVLVACSVLWPLVAGVHCGRALRANGRQVAAARGLSRRAQLRTMLRLALRYNCPPGNYYKFRLYDEAPDERCLQYLHNQQVVNLLRALNAASEVKHYDHKVLFAETAARHGLRAASPIVEFRSGRPRVWWRHPHRLPETDLVAKLADGVCGIGFECWDYVGSGHWQRGTQRLGEADLLRHCAEKAPWSDVLLQERLANHPALTRLAGRGLATIRMVTCSRVGEPPDLFMATFRMPTGDSRVDNFAAGGLAAPVHLATGRLGVAVRKSGVSDTPTHPDTGGRIEGTALPCWNEARELVTQAHGRFGDLRFVGWDVAITADGPVLIEANPYWCGELLQIPSRRALGDTAFPRTFADHWGAGRAAGGHAPPGRVSDSAAGL